MIQMFMIDISQGLKGINLLSNLNYKLANES